MKTIAKIFFVLLFTACSTNSLEVEETTISKVDLKSIDDFAMITINLDSNFDMEDLTKRQYPSSNLHKNELETLKEILNPLIKEGKDLRKNLISTTSNKAQPKDVEELNNLTEEELALVGFISIIQKEMLNKQMRKLKDVDADRVWACLGTATGYSSIKAVIDTSGLMSAQTLLQTVKAMGKRYLGYVGVAVMVYSFSKCMDLI